VPKRPGEPDCTWANIDKITRLIGWRPVISFEAGVRNMTGEIDRWNDAPLWDPASIAKATETWFRYMGKNPTY
jgi:UDP-glucose 4-epimerase